VIHLYCWAIGLAALLVPSLALAQDAHCTVSYLSSEYVYLDAGADQGLAAGMRVRVTRGNAAIAELEVAFVAGRSASCRVVATTGEIKPHDTVTFRIEPTPEVEIAPPTAQRLRAPGRERTPVAGDVGLDLQGNVGLLWDHIADRSGPGLESDLLTLPFRLQAHGLGHGVELRARGSLRRETRDGYSAATPALEWRNRILEVALVRDDPRNTWNYAIGRIGSRVAAAAGPFDGFRADRRISGAVLVGVFAGFAPEWGSLGFGTDDRLGGVTFQWNRRSADDRMLDVVVAAVGRYSESEISRECLAMTTTWRRGNRLSLLQAAEVDLNRGWRKDAAGRTLFLSSFALNGRWQATTPVALSLGWDDREPVRTWETRSLPDSLFEDAGRRGLSAGVNWRLGRGRSLDLRGSLRRDDLADALVRSWNSRLYLTAFPVGGLNFDVSVRQFDGPHLAGWSPSAGLAYNSRRGVDLRVAGGYCGYADRGGRAPRSTSWCELGGTADLAAGWSLGVQFHRDWGGGLNGDRWLLEWRRRF
jgi:hypothetical protein